MMWNPLRRRKHKVTISKKKPSRRTWLHLEQLEIRELLAGGSGGTGGTPPLALGDVFSIYPNHALSVAASGVLGNDTGYNGQALTAVQQTGVSHGSLTLNSNGGFTYTPTTGYTGSDSFTYKAYDGSQYSTSAATVTINVTDQAPVVINPGAQSTNQGSAVSLPITASDAACFSLTYGASGLPSGLSINSSTGLISGTLPPHSPGSNSTSVSVNDGFLTTTISFVWTIVDNTPPVFVNPGTQSTRSGQAVSLPLSASDPDGLALTYSASGLPAGLALNTSTGLISGTPTASALITSNVTVSATNGFATGTASFSWRVTVPSQPTITSPGAQTSHQGDIVSLAIQASASGGDPLTYSASGLPSGLIIDPNSGLINGSIAASGPATFTVLITVADSPYTSTATFVWTVAAATSLPVVTNPGAQSNAEGQAISLQVQASAANGHSLTYAASGLPGGLSMNASTGLISGTLAYGDASTNSGSYSIVVSATDSSQGTTSASFQWTVVRTTQPPVAQSQSDSTLKNTAVAITLQGSDPDNDPLTYALASSPAHGTVSLNGATATYTPASGYVGADSFTFSAAFGQQISQPATVSINVVSGGIAGSPRSLTLNQGPGTGSVVVASFTDSNSGLPLSAYSAQIDWGDGVTSSGTISANTSGGFNVTGSHAYGEHGVFPVNVLIKDGAASTTVTSTANVGVWTMSNATPTGSSISRPAGTVLPTHDFVLPTAPDSGGSGGTPPGGSSPPGGSNLPSANLPSGGSFTPPSVDLPVTGLISLPSAGGMSGSGSAPSWNSSPSQSGGDGLAASSFTSPSVALPSAAGVSSSSGGTNSFNAPVNYVGLGNSVYTALEIGTYTYTYGIAYAADGSWTAWSTAAYSLQLQVTTVGSGLGSTLIETMSYSFQYAASGSGSSMSYTLSVGANESYTYHESGGLNVPGTIFNYALDLSGSDRSTLTASGGAGLGSGGWISTNQYVYDESGSTGSQLNLSGSDAATVPGGTAGDLYSATSSSSAGFTYHETGSAGTTGASSSSTYNENGSQSYAMQDSGLTTVATPFLSGVDAYSGQYTYSENGSISYTYQATAGAARSLTGSSANDSYSYNETGSSGANMSSGQSDTWQGTSSTGTQQGTSSYQYDAQAGQDYTTQFSGNDSFTYSPGGSVTASGSDSNQLTQNANDSYTIHSSGNSSSSGSGAASTFSYSSDVTGSDDSALVEGGGGSYQLATGQVATSHSNDSYTFTANSNDTFNSQESGSNSTTSSTAASFVSWSSTDAGSDTSTSTETGQAAVNYSSDTGITTQWSDTYTFSGSGSDNYTDQESGNDSLQLSANDTIVMAGYLPGQSVASSDSYTYSDGGNSSYTVNGNGNDSPGAYADHYVYTEGGSTTFHSKVQGTDSSASATSSNGDTYDESDHGTVDYSLQETANDSSDGVTVTSSIGFTDSETDTDDSTLHYTTTSSSTQVGSDGSTKTVTDASDYSDTFSDTFTSHEAGTATGSSPVTGATGSTDFVVTNAYSTTDDSTDDFTFSDTTTTHVVGVANGLNYTGTIVDDFDDTGSYTFSMSVGGNDTSETLNGTTIADNNSYTFSNDETGTDSFTDNRTANATSNGVVAGQTITSSESTTSNDSGNDTYVWHDEGSGASTLAEGVSTSIDSGSYTYSDTTDQNYSVTEADTDGSSSSSTYGTSTSQDVFNSTTSGNDTQSIQEGGSYSGGTGGSTSSETYTYDDSGNYTSHQDMSGSSGSTFGTSTNTQTYSGTQNATNSYTGHQTGGSNSIGSATSSNDSYTYSSQATNQSTWHQTATGSSSGTDSSGNALSSSLSSSLDEASQDTSTTNQSGEDAANGTSSTWNLTTTTTDSDSFTSSAVNDATQTTGSATSQSHSTENDSSTLSQSQTSVAQDGTTHTTFQNDGTTQSDSTNNTTGTSPNDNFTSKTTSTSDSTDHEDGTDGSQNFTVTSESGSTSSYTETYGSAGSNDSSTTNGHTGTASIGSPAFQATYTKTSSDHTTLNAGGTIAAGVASYSNYNYQNTSALNYSLSVSGAIGTMSASAGGSSTTSVTGTGASAVTTSSVTVTYSLVISALGVDTGNSYTINTSAATALATAASQGWSWVVSQASAAWQGITDAAWTTVQTIWTGLQQAYTWLVSAGEWIWGIAGKVVTFVGDAAIMVANGATFGQIPSLSAKANELKQKYGAGVFWVCNIVGGVAAVAVVVVGGSAIIAVGGGPILVSMGIGAAIGVGADAYVQLMRMADGTQAPWEWNLGELATAGGIGAVAGAIVPFLPAGVVAWGGLGLSAFGVSKGAYDLYQGNLYTGTSEILMGILGGIFARNALPGKGEEPPPVQTGGSRTLQALQEVEAQQIAAAEELAAREAGVQAMALSRQQALNRLQGLERSVLYHLDEHIPQTIGQSPSSIPHWRTEVGGFLNDMERLANGANIGLKTSADWLARIAEYRIRLTNLLGE